MGYCVWLSQLLRCSGRVFLQFWWLESMSDFSAPILTFPRARGKGLLIASVMFTAIRSMDN